MKFMTDTRRRFVQWSISFVLVSMLFWSGWMGQNYWLYYLGLVLVGLAAGAFVHFRKPK